MEGLSLVFTSLGERLVGCRSTLTEI